MKWASDHDASLSVLHRVQGSLPVALIMVPRRHFHTCKPTDKQSAIKADNQDLYSFMPVTDDNDRIIGLYDAQRWFQAEPPDAPVSDSFQRLCESMIIGENASIFDFILRAEERPTCLVVSDSGIGGLVSISDLQQLPVRAALFALITSLEMAMSLRIRAHWPEGSNGWLDLLPDQRAASIQKSARHAVRKNAYVDDVILTNFSDKADVVREAGLLGSDKAQWTDPLKGIQGLRNDLAHAKPFAASPEKAVHVCQMVKMIFAIKKLLIEGQ
jgi:hypothetical protein